MNPSMRTHGSWLLGGRLASFTVVLGLGFVGAVAAQETVRPTAPDAPLPPTPTVTLLEAVHVAEIHTGCVAESAFLEEQDAVAAGSRHYLIRTRREAAVLEVRVNARHGRLESIRRVSGADSGKPVYEWPGVRVVAHRGGAELGPPENTLPAIERAIEVGADLIEIDIRETADGHLVLMHDATVDRMTDGRGSVADFTLEQIRSLRVDTGGRTTGGDAPPEPPVRVPTLAEALKAMHGRIDADLDFKEGDLTRLLAVVRQAGMEHHSTFCGPWDRCEEIVRLEPAIRIRPTAEHPTEVAAMIRRLRPAIVNLDWHAVTADAVRSAHLGGCHAFVNCLGSADTEFYARLAIGLGADYVQSDRPDRVIRILEELGLRSGRVPSGDPLGTPLRAMGLQYPLR
ncbi:MAG: glycerophosphodiester phosphodiesterase family protein [Verrucomicrobiales bacterium]|nr:glycerophosphodiester phosphodiesterase family protein [Verrucomicrobiales bacterium]